MDTTPKRHKPDPKPKEDGETIKDDGSTQGNGNDHGNDSNQQDQNAPNQYLSSQYLSSQYLSSQYLSSQYLSSQYKYEIISVTDIAPNPEQPRKDFDTSDLRKNILTEGVLQPIIVKRNTNGNGNGKGYTLIDGERRWRAASKEKFKEIPAIVVPSNIEPKKLAELAMTLNMQRKDLTALEEAEGFKNLQDVYGYKQKELATIIGKSDNYLSEILAIAKLPEQIKKEVRNSDTKYSRHFLLKLLKQKDEQKMLEYLKKHESKTKGASSKGTSSKGTSSKGTSSKGALPNQEGNSSHEDEGEEAGPSFDSKCKCRGHNFRLILEYNEAEVDSIKEKSLKAVINKIIERLNDKHDISLFPLE